MSISENHKVNNGENFPVDPVNIKALEFGYLTGIDLLQFLKNDFLVSVWRDTYDVTDFNKSALSRSCEFAISQAYNSLNTIYNFEKELLNRGEARNNTIVRMCSILACYEVSSIDEKVKSILCDRRKEVMKELDCIKMRKFSIPNLEYSDKLSLSMPFPVSKLENFMV